MNSEQYLKSNLVSNLTELVAQSCHTLKKWFREGKKIQSTAEDLFLVIDLCEEVFHPDRDKFGYMA